MFPSAPPQITMSDLPSNHLYDLPPQNCQVRFTLKLSVRFTTLKSPSPIYPQIVCMIYPPKITKSDLPSNHLYDLPPQEVNRTDDLRVNRTDDLRANQTWRFRGGVNRTDDLRVNCTDNLRANRTWPWWFRGGKSYRRFEGKSDLGILGGGKSSNIFHQVNTFHPLS